METCTKCGAAIEQDEKYEYHGGTLCEDCYLDVLNPPKSCDPWAVHTAKSFATQGQQLTTSQERILNLLKERGPVTAKEVMETLNISESEFKNSFATLRHMELARGFKQDNEIYYTLFSS
jgi:hypothetical protein